MRSIHLTCAAILLGGAMGCGPSLPEYKPEPASKVYSVSMRPTAPQPTYNRLRWVYSPDVLPSKDLPGTSSTRLAPVYHFKLDNTSLKEAGQVLGSSMRYASRCLGANCDDRVTIEVLGSPEEVAEKLSGKTGVRFSLDHSRKEVRVGGSSPRLYGEEGAGNDDAPAVSEDTIPEGS